MKPQVDPHETASLLSDVTNLDAASGARSKTFVESAPGRNLGPTTSGPALGAGSSTLSSSSFNAGRGHAGGGSGGDGLGSRTGSAGRLAPRRQASWNGASAQAPAPTAQQVAAAVVNAGPAPAPAAQHERPKPKDMRKSISGGMKPEKKTHKEKQMKLVVHPDAGPMQGNGVPPPSDCQVIDERTWLTDRIVQFPCCSLSAMLLIPLVMAMVALLKAPFELDIGVDSFEIRSTHFSQQRYLAMNEAVKEENSHYTNRRQLWTPPSQRLGRLEMIYAPRKAVAYSDRPEKVSAATDTEEYDGIEMLRLDRLDYVRKIERAIQDFEGYQKYCRPATGLDAQSGDPCSPPSSLITYLYPTTTGDCDFEYDGKGTSLVRPISETMTALAAISNEEHYHWFFSTTHTEQKSTLIRSQFMFAMDHRPTQDERDEFDVWLGDLIDALERQKAENPETNGVVYLVGGSVPTRILVLRALNSDMVLALLSFFLVLLYTWFHTTSLVLSIMAMLMIALSFPVSLFFYYMFFGDAKLGVLNILSIYIVLGIGVDDCYVFLDAFQQNRHAPELSQGFGAAFNRSARAMFVTSFTTALAFLANMISSIPVIFSFAVFMATLVIVNYVFTITIFVGIVSVWHQYIETKEKIFFSELQRRIPCLHKMCQLCNSTAEEMTELPQKLRSTPATPQTNQVEGSHPAPDIDDFATLEDAFIVIDETSPANARAAPAPLKGNSTDHEKIVDQLRKHNIHIRSLRKTERWFLFTFGPFLNRNRRNIIGFATILVLLSAIMAARLTPSRDIPHLFPSDHPIQLHWSFKNSNFTGGYCDECAATFETDFMCHDVLCGGGNTCMFGKCYSNSGREPRALLPSELPYIPAGISARVAEACNRPGDGERAAMPNAAVHIFGTNTRADQAQRALEAYMGVYAPSGDLNAAGCDDDYRECFAWAQRGECDDNPAFMNSNCKYSCGLCEEEVENYHQCDDGDDNDSDGLTDCDDPDCAVIDPRCALTEDDRNQLAAAVCSMTVCRAFIDDFLNDCTNSVQRTDLKSVLNQSPTCSAHDLGVEQLALPVGPSCYYRPLDGEKDGSRYDKASSVEVATCICDGSEMSFYLATGLMSLGFASFNIYAAYQAMNRRNDMFEHRLAMATAAMFYMYGVVPCCFWLSCFPGPNESKENGFFGMMLFCGLCCAFGMAALRKKWNSDFMERPDMGSNYMYFCGFCTVMLIAFCIFGLAKTSSSSSWDAVDESHILSECKALSNMNSTKVDTDEDLSSEEMEEQVRTESIEAECRDDEIGCRLQCDDHCGAPERMLYSVGAFLMITGSLGCMGCMRLDGMKQSPWQATLTNITLAPFLVYGLMTALLVIYLDGP